MVSRPLRIGFSTCEPRSIPGVYPLLLTTSDRFPQLDRHAYPNHVRFYRILRELLAVQLPPLTLTHTSRILQTYAIFAGINFLIAVTVYILYPETAKRSLESIDLIFEQSNPKTPWDVVGIAKRLPYDSHVTDDENGVHLSAEAKYALKVRERKGYTASEKGAAEHYEHQDAPSRRFDDGAPTKE
jgi:hypothetical protein